MGFICFVKCIHPSQRAFKLNLSPDSDEPWTLNLEDLTFILFYFPPISHVPKIGFLSLTPESQIEFDHSSLIILTLRGIWHRGEGDHANCIAILLFWSVVLKPSGALFVFPSFLESSRVQWSIWLLFHTFKWQKYAKILKTLVSFPN